MSTSVMNEWLTFLVSQAASDELVQESSGHESVRAFMMREIEYGAMSRGVGLADRSERGLIAVRGADRLPWCHNLLTNQVNTLQPGDGTYTFAVNLQGRIVFDCVLMVRLEDIWLDVDRSFVEAAIAHLEQFIIVEDVELADCSGDFVRLGLAGPKMGDVMTALGASNAAKMPWYGNAFVRWDDIEIPFLRHDFCGPVGVELFVPSEHAQRVWTTLTTKDVGAKVVPTGHDAVETHRIESGIVRSGCEIHPKVVVGETLQFDRAVSSTKGCYLGQEVVERMRSRGSLAKQLIGLEIDGDSVPPAGAEVFDEGGKAVGRITSACDSIAKGGLIGMGYVRSAVSEPGSILKVKWDGGEADAVVSQLPFVKHAEA